MHLQKVKLKLKSSPPLDNDFPKYHVQQLTNTTSKKINFSGKTKVEDPSAVFD